jgi:ribosomal protein S18 acetylase RimI-like enzyme
MRICYRKLEESDKEEVVAMIQAFYEEDMSGKRKAKEQVYKSLEAFEKHPDYGSVTVFTAEEIIVGYCIIVHFYSNEYGGMMLYIDELYVVPEYRGKGIATDFIRQLRGNNEIDCVAMKLEVLPYNTKAFKLYERLGFVESDRSYMMLRNV